MSFIQRLNPIMNGLMANDGTGDNLRAGANDINSSWSAIEQAVNALAAAQGAGVVVYATQAAMLADTSQRPGTAAWVLNDPTPANNTSYGWDGHTWSAAYDRLSFALGNGSGFLQDGPGAVLQDIQKVLRERVTPENFGAIADGTSNDTAAVQKALDSGRAVVTLTRDYACGHVQMNTPGQILVGQGGRLVALNSSISNAAHLTVAADGCKVIGIRMTDPFAQGATLASATGNRNYGIEITANNCAVHANHIDNYQNGVAVRAGSGTSEWIGNAISGNVVTNVQGVGSLGSAYGEDRGDGIVSWGCVTSITGNVVIAAPGTDARVGIHVEALGSFNTSSYAYKDRIGAISGNVVVGHFRRGIVNEGVYNGTISGNVVAGTSWWGIAVIESKAVSVSGNSILFDRATGDNAGSNWSPIRGPIMIYATTACSNITVADNSVVIAGAADSCMSAQGPVDNVTFSENTISLEGTGSATNAMNIIGATNVSILDNRFPTVSGTALFSSSGAQISRIRGNKIAGNAGLNVANSNLEMAGNDITVVNSTALDVGAGLTNVRFNGNTVKVTGTAASAVRSTVGIECNDNYFTLAAGQTQACLRHSSAAPAGTSFRHNTITADSASAHSGVFVDSQTSSRMLVSDNQVSGQGASFALFTYSGNAGSLICRNNRFATAAGYMIKNISGQELGPWYVGDNMNGNISVSRDPNITANLQGSIFNPAGSKLNYLLPAAGGLEGIVCITGGAPGTWKTYGSISS